MREATRFTADDADQAHDAWGCNCGPGAVAAIMGMTLDEVRPHMAAAGFEARRYTSPSMMTAVLQSIGRPWRRAGTDWPVHGLVRIQWEGPWTMPGVPVRARYRHTHWIAACRHPVRGIGVFDINALGNGTGWCALEDWSGILVPWLLEQCVPRANGGWHVTHAIEVSDA